MQDSTKLLSLLILSGVLILLYGTLFLLSVSIVESRRSQLRTLLEDRSRKLAQIRRILSSAPRYLLSLQLGKFVIAVVIGFCAVELLYCDTVTTLLYRTAPENIFGGRVFLFCVSIFLICFLVLVSVQIAKALAHAHPERILVFMAIPLIWFVRFVEPLAAVPNLFVSRVLGRWGIPLPVEREGAVSAEELSELVEISSQAGEIEDDEREMIQGVVEFSETLVREVMTPRADIVSVNQEDTLETVKSTFLAEGFSRLVVIGDELDDVQGILNAKDLIPLVGKETVKFDWRGLLRKPYFVTGNQLVGDVLEELQRDATHIAIVLDEHGGVDGIITIEDLIEEIVGEIFDEYDSPEEEEEVQETGGGELLVDGGMAVDDLNQMHGFSFPDGEYDTLAGFVIHVLGHIPEQGECLDYSGVRIQVEELNQNRVTLLRLTPVVE